MFHYERVCTLLNIRSSFGNSDMLVFLCFFRFPDSRADAYFINNKENRNDSCHFHRIISPRNEVIIGQYPLSGHCSHLLNSWTNRNLFSSFEAHCPGTSPVLECRDRDSFETYQSHDAANYVEIPTEQCAKHQCCCHKHHHECTPDDHRHGKSRNRSAFIFDWA